GPNLIKEMTKGIERRALDAFCRQSETTEKSVVFLLFKKKWSFHFKTLSLLTFEKWICENNGDGKLNIEISNFTDDYYSGNSYLFFF
ncbi:hypothetical protein, partial [Solibacillus merdavium]|uniref:hypothetical protein n=1 Tax=Solibacillus merdavium TaxID=2762218 RepID=UPI001CD8D1B5